MLPHSLRATLDRVWDSVWSSGITNPLAVVEYLTAVLVLYGASRVERTTRLATEIRDAIATGDGERARIGMSQLLTVHGLPPVEDAMFADVQLMARAVRSAAELAGDLREDVLGDCFEHVLSHLSTAGHFGQFRTPRHVVEFLVRAVDPKPHELVLDPACGTGGFLIEAHKHRGASQGGYKGDESDHTIARIAHANLKMHSVDNFEIRKRDSLSDLAPEADVILANPPFAGRVDGLRASVFRSRAMRSEILFVELAVHRLVPGGRVGMVVPFGLLTNNSRPAVFIRKMLIEEHWVQTIVELPAGTFRPYTDVKTALILWSARRNPDGSILMLKARTDGFTLDDRRSPIDDNELDELLPAVMSGEEALIPRPGMGRRVPISELAEDHYSLNPSRCLGAGLPTVERLPSVETSASEVVSSAERLRDILRAIEREIGVIR